MKPGNVSQLWDEATRHLKGILHTDVFQRWISIIKPVELSDHSLVLSVDNDFYQTWLEEHYMPIIKNAVASACGSPLEISFTVCRQASASSAAKPESDSTPKPASGERVAKRAKNGAPLNESFSFNNFVVGPCNNFAHAAALAVAQAPARAYNPLFIYGGVGLGKTHIMQAIGHYVRENSRANVCYLSSEAFLNEYINALQTKGLVQFRRKYRHSDLLLIDDIHFLAMKTGLQEEFFHTFNTLFDAHKQIVMTSDRPASEIVGLERRLVSRFEWGLVTEMEPPDLETRMAILRHKLAKTQVTLDDNTILFIAENIRSNIRRLEGALTSVIAYASLTREPLTPECVRRLLRGTIDEQAAEALTCATIQKAVVQHYDIGLADMLGNRRPKIISLPRQVAMYLCRQLTKGSLPQIGQAFGKTHATVLHACREMEKQQGSDQDLRRAIHGIAKSLGKTL